MADRRRAGSRRQEGPHLHHLAAGARADRQEERRPGRGRHAGRRQGLRGRQAGVEVNSRWRRP